MRSEEEENQMKIKWHNDNKLHMQVKENNASGLKIVKDTKHNNTLQLLDKSFATKNLSNKLLFARKSIQTCSLRKYTRFFSRAYKYCVLLRT